MVHPDLDTQNQTGFDRVASSELHEQRVPRTRTSCEPKPIDRKITGKPVQIPLCALQDRLHTDQLRKDPERPRVAVTWEVESEHRFFGITSQFLADKAQEASVRIIGCPH
jgi:hypothetical protein